MATLAPRESSRSAVLATLLAARELDRAHLVAATGLSQATVFRVVDELMHDALVVEGERQSRGGPGRTARAVKANPRYAMVAGVELGSERCRIVLADALGETAARRDLPTPPGESALELAEWLAERLRATVTESEDAAPIGALAVALPGIVAAGGRRVTASRTLARVEGEAFVRHLRHLLGVPVAFDNDSSLALLGELRFGGAPAGSTTALLTLGAGMSVAVALDGRVLAGTSGLLGEFERLQLPESGRRLSELLSETGLAPRATDGRLDALFMGDPSPSDAAIIAELRAAFTHLVSIVELAYEPAAMLVTGPLADRLDDALLAETAASVSASLDADVVLRRSALREAAVELGAMSLALESLYLGMGVAAADVAGIAADRDAALRSFARHEPAEAR
jgi:predicted NBD/HSP70 family sugar kinase